MMKRIPAWRRYARIFGADPRADVDDELEFHIETRVEELVAQGWDPASARRQAESQFGDLAAIRQAGEELHGRRRRTLERRDWWSGYLHDVRYTLRCMRRATTFTIAVVLTLGLGTGAIATVFTLANTLFFRRLPVDRPEQVAMVQATKERGRMPGWVSYPEYVHFRDHTRSFAGLAAHYSNAPLFTTIRNQSREVTGAVVSANFFPLLGLQPALGRFFRDDEDAVPDRDRVAVLGYDAWSKWFGRSPEVLGAPLRINGATFTIVGVAPEAFRGITIQPDDVYLPTMMSRAAFTWCADSLAVDCRPFYMIGRLANGRTAAEAEAEMSTLLPTWWTGQDGGNSAIRVLPARGVFHPDLSRSEERRFVELLAAVAATLLLVCCANLAGLLMSRNMARKREFAIRSSLGAGNARLMRQLATESMVLALGGGLAGLLLSRGLTAALNALFYSADRSGRPIYYNFAPEPRVLFAVAAVSMLAGLLAGVIPAWRTLERSGAASLKQPRIGRWLAGAQAAAAVALAAIAGVLAVSAQALLTASHFDAAHVALLRIRPRAAHYTPERAQQFVRAAIQRLEALPAVESATMVGTGAVLVGNNAQAALPEWIGTRSIHCTYLRIGPRYFETLRTPVLRGREFDQRDNLQSPAVALVSESLARTLWPGGAAIGALVEVNGRPHQVVGIAADVTLQNRTEAQRPYVYTPYWQNAAQVETQLAVRVKGDPAAMLPEIVREVGRGDPDVPIGNTVTLAADMAAGISSERITGAFLSFAAGLSVVLAGIGLYGVLAYSMSHRTREIGIRMAVGATAAGVRRMVVREGMAVVLTGVAAGVGLSLGGAREVRHLLYGSGAGDAAIYAAAAVLVAAVGLLACWIPARRAAAIEPMSALREQ
jgi:predicted permease